MKQYREQWSDFRNWVTAELHGLTRRLIREIRPDLILLAYDYTLAPGGKAPAFVANSPMNTLLYDPHVDVHLVSYYNREGTVFLDAVDNDVTHLKKPVWAIPFLMKNINNVHRQDYDYNQISARELRFEIVAAAASGARGHLGFPGKLLDADYLRAYAEGVAVVARYKPFYLDGRRADKLVTLVHPHPNVRHRVHRLDGKLLLTLFNCGEKSLDVEFEFNGRKHTVSVDTTRFRADGTHGMNGGRSRVGCVWDAPSRQECSATITFPLERQLEFPFGRAIFSPWVRFSWMPRRCVSPFRGGSWAR